MKRGEFEELDNLRGLGHLLISSRIAQGISQHALARRLGVHETQVSRDERNEYFSITLERAAKILDALNVQLRTYPCMKLRMAGASNGQSRKCPLPVRVAAAMLLENASSVQGASTSCECEISSCTHSLIRAGW